jgi:AcrR family transcriptional regulator
MKTGSKHQSAEMRRQQIVSAADLVLIEVGVDDFTIDQVADRANIAKGTVYKYFKSKDEILAAVSVKGLSLLLESFERQAAQHTHGVEKMKAICLASYHYYQTYPTYYELLSYIERPEFKIDVKEYVRISHAIQGFCQRVLEEGQHRGEINPSINPYLATRVMWASNFGVIQFAKTKKKLIENTPDISIDAMINTYIEMTGNALTNPNHK